MKRLLALAAAIALTLAGCGPSSDNAAPNVAPPATSPGGAAAPGAGKTGLISITLEVRPSILIQAAMGEVHAPVVVMEDKDAALGKYVIGPEGPDHKELSVGGDATYKLRVIEPGDYFLWLRANWCCSCGNSVDLSLDGARLGAVEDSVTKTWHWVMLQKPLRNLTAGDHLLTLINREDGAGVDQILLTQDADYRPTGIEPMDAQGRVNGLIQDAPVAPGTTIAPAK